MRIDCCYCGRARQRGVRLPRRCHACARPRSGRAARRCRAARGTTTSTCATTRPARIASCGITRRLPRLAGRDARHAHARRSSRVEAAARAVRSRARLRTPRDGRRRPRPQPAPRLASRAGSDRPQPSRSRFTFDGRALSRPSRRHAGLGAARQRRAAGRPLVQVPPAARHPDGRAGGAQRAGRAAHRRAARAEHARDHGRALRRARRREPEPLAVARASTCWRSTQLLAPFLVGGLLLQDLHVAGVVLGEGLRAADPPRRRPRPRRRREPIPTPTRRRSRIATCWSSAAGRPA